MRLPHQNVIRILSSFLHDKDCKENGIWSYLFSQILRLLCFQIFFIPLSFRMASIPLHMTDLILVLVPLTASDITAVVLVSLIILKVTCFKKQTKSS